MEKAIDQIARINPQPTAEAGSLSCHATIQAIAKTVSTKLTMDITFNVFIKFLSLNSTFTVSIHLIRIFVNTLVVLRSRSVAMDTFSCNKIVAFVFAN